MNAMKMQSLELRKENEELRKENEAIVANYTA